MPEDVVGEGESLGVRSNMDVELLFGDIDPDPGGSGRRGDGIDPVLQIRTRVPGRSASVLAAVRAGTREASAILLCDGLLKTKTQSREDEVVTGLLLEGDCKSEPSG